VKKVHEYDLQTVAGGEYRLRRKGKVDEVEAPQPMEQGPTAFYDMQGRAATAHAKGLLVSKSTQDGRNVYHKIIKQ